MKKNANSTQNQQIVLASYVGGKLEINKIKVKRSRKVKVW